MSIRLMTLEDWNNGFPQTLSSIRQADATNDKIVEIFNTRLKQGIQTYVMEDDSSKVIATGSLFVEQKYYRNGGKVAHIEDLSVDGSQQGKGYGKKMMDALKTIAEENQCYKMVLDCSEKNVPFYQKTGFHIHETQMRLDLV